MYSSIRQRLNIFLIAGSGFGAAEDIWPYLTGGQCRDMVSNPCPSMAFIREQGHGCVGGPHEFLSQRSYRRRSGCGRC
jgi:Domain of unknown function (DUF1729)